LCECGSAVKTQRGVHRPATTRDSARGRSDYEKIEGNKKKKEEVATVQKEEEGEIPSRDCWGGSHEERREWVRAFLKKDR